MKRFALLALVALIVLTLAVTAAQVLRPYTFRGQPLQPLRPAADFILTDWNENTFRLSDQRGRIVLLFFGYTTCPDVCPTTLAKLRKVRGALGAEAAQVRFVFITVDPERDTTARLKHYVETFSPDFIGLTGDRVTLAGVWESYGVYAERQEVQGSAVGYLMIHSSWTYLVDQEGNLRLIYPYEATEEDIVHIGLIALALGTAFGPLQGLQYAGVNLYGPLSSLIRSYYQGLTLHGVLNALVWTIFFIMGFSVFVTVRMLNRALHSPGLAWAGFWVMVVGVVLAAYAILTNQASVLYTLYLPMQAHPTFYIGATLLVVGTWVISAELFLTYRQWRAANPGVRTPLGVFGILVNLALWILATLGVAAEMLFLAIPWSLGLVAGTDPLLARTLFWFFGHPLVYFWLLPAYVSWYAMLPKQGGGKLFSALDSAQLTLELHATTGKLKVLSNHAPPRRCRGVCVI